MEFYDNLPTVIILSVIAIVGTLANIVIILYVYLVKFPSTAFNFLIVVLAGVDLLCCFLLLPLDIVTLARPDMLPTSTMCGLLGIGVCSTGVTTGLVLAAIAFIRYRLVCHPHAEKITVFQVKWFTLISVIVGLVFGWPPIVVTKRTTIVLDSRTLLIDCGIDKAMQDTAYPMAFYVTLCMVFNIIMVALTIWYTKLARILWSRRKIFVIHDTDASSSAQSGSDKNAIIIHFQGGDNSSASNRPRQRAKPREIYRQSESSRAVLMMFIVTLVFFTSYLPHFALVFFGAIIRLFSYEGMVSYSLVYRLIYTNNIANFIVYSVFSSAFRKQIYSLSTRIINCSR